jgi:[ribosomal protein S5]-alanine N-acetyltransferase
MSTVLKTPRLELVGCTPHTLRAEGEDRAGFAALLDARIPDAWPPELYDDDARLWTLAALDADPDAAAWWLYYVVLDGDAGPREAIGVAGYKGPPGDDGTVEVGYGILPGFRRRGHATEAARALVEHAFAHPAVTRVVAETYPHLAPSLGVMRNLGMAFCGPGCDDGVVRYTLSRARWRGHLRATAPGEPSRAGGA